MQKKKISIFIISLYGGGAERVVSILIEYLKKDFDVHLVLLNNIIEYKIPEGQKVHILEKVISKNNFVNIVKIPFLAYRYWRYLSQNSIETSFSFLTRPNYIAGFLKLLGWRGKVICSERIFTSLVYTNDTLRGRIGRFLIRKLYAKADVIVCNSKLMVQDLKETFNIQTDFRVIYNPVDIENVQKGFNETENVPAKNKNTFRFVAIGRLNEGKNHKLLIRAASLINEFNFDIQIIGKGAMQEELKQYIAKYNVADKVSIIPFTKNPYSYLKQADCFVLPSSVEGFPNVVLEALSCELPVIATDCKSGPRELLAPSLDIKASLNITDGLYEYGMLVKVDDDEGLAQAMVVMYNNAELRSGYQEKAMRRAQDFSIEKIIAQFKDLLNEQ